MKAIHILSWIDSHKNPFFVDMGRKRKLYQDPMDRRIPIQIPDMFKKDFLSGIGGEPNISARHPYFCQGPFFGGNIRNTRGIGTHKNNREAGRHPLLLEIGHPGDKTLPDLPGNFFSINNLGGHRFLL
jgi:hypothetical protein